MKFHCAMMLLAVTTVSIPGVVRADESLWIYAKGAETLPKAETELKAVVVSRRGKADSEYAFNDVRFEVEHGITDRLTAQAELIIYDHDYSTTNPDLQPYFDSQGGTGGRFRKTSIGGLEVGVKYNVLSPYKDVIGLAFSAAWDHRFKYRLDGATIDQDSLELTAHFQKNFLNNTLVFAFSPQIEFEHRLSPGTLENEIAFDIAAGVSYRVAPKWNVGAEFRHQSDYLNPRVNGQYEPGVKRSKFGLNGFQIGSQYQYGNYLGPTVHYADKRWWATAGALWQVSGGGKRAFNRSGRNVDEHEKVHVGLTLGLEL